MTGIPFSRAFYCDKKFSVLLSVCKFIFSRLQNAEDRRDLIVACIVPKSSPDDVIVLNKDRASAIFDIVSTVCTSERKDIVNGVVKTMIDRNFPLKQLKCFCDSLTNCEHIVKDESLSKSILSATALIEAKDILQNMENNSKSEQFVNVRRYLPVLLVTNQTEVKRLEKVLISREGDFSLNFLKCAQSEAKRNSSCCSKEVLNMIRSIAVDLFSKDASLHVADLKRNQEAKKAKLYIYETTREKKQNKRSSYAFPSVSFPGNIDIQNFLRGSKVCETFYIGYLPETRRFVAKHFGYHGSLKLEDDCVAIASIRGAGKVCRLTVSKKDTFDETMRRALHDINVFESKCKTKEKILKAKGQTFIDHCERTGMEEFISPSILHRMFSLAIDQPLEGQVGCFSHGPKVPSASVTADNPQKTAKKNTDQPSDNPSSHKRPKTDLGVSPTVNNSSRCKVNETFNDIIEID